MQSHITVYNLVTLSINNMVNLFNLRLNWFHAMLKWYCISTYKMTIHTYLNNHWTLDFSDCHCGLLMRGW